MNNLTFGIDLGIASCGWAVVRHPADSDASGEIVALGSWMFDVPETDKERTPTNQVRRGNRLLRRVIRRRRNRMNELRHLFRANDLIGSAEADALKRKGLNPWELRARGLDKPLEPAELAIALGHIAKRRGFKSAAKRKEANIAGDDQKMLKALEATKERLGRYRTVGEMFARDPDFGDRRRNRDGLFDRTASRGDLAREVAALFQAQRRLGNNSASEELEQTYIAIAFRQRPMQDSERLVGTCLFEPGEKRAAKLSPSFELFRLLSRLVNLRITTDEGERPLTPEELARATADLGATAKLSVKKARALIGLPAEHRFTTIKPEQEDIDIAARTGEAMPGTRALRKALGEEVWAKMREQPEQLDRIAHVLSFFETSDKIVEELGKLGLDEDVRAALSAGLDTGAFGRFKGAGGFSAKAVRALIPHLMQGKRFDQACAAVGYDHAASKWTGREQVADKKAFNKLVADLGEEIANPIARKSLTEGLKQLWAMRNEWGLPAAIHIELARDVGNSIEKRREIERNLEKTTADRQRERKEAAEQLGLNDPTSITGDTLLRYRLWKEQGGRCLYTDEPIPPSAIDARDNSVQVDHILPWSRFGDDSFNNKTLCLARANQRKRRATPFEWFSADFGADAWDAFVARVESCKTMKGFKKRNYLLKNAKEAEEKFRSRNLNDTRYAARLLAEAARLFFPHGERQEKDGIRRVYTRPGALTAALRTAWGIESLKKVDGKRVEDARHHALDAVVVAAVSEAEVQHLTRSFQEWEQQGLGRPLRRVDEPWDGFREDVKAALSTIFVARPERRRARGEGHAATIRQVKERDGAPVVFERKSILDLTEKRLDDIKDPERNAALIDALRAWIKAGKPAAQPPRSPRGDEISKVRLRTKGKPSVSVRGGTADRGEIIRVDVFTKPNKRGKDEFYLVPIYPHQVMDKRNWPEPPVRAIVAYKDENDWTLIDDSFHFRFSLYPRSYVEVVKPSGEVFEGYFGGVHRGTGAINLFAPHDPKTRNDGIGAKTLLTMKKYNVDRFGRRAEVKQEVRTWHGVACTSPSPPG
ncbi:MAG TPA: type II CRISPR RNA-guided endonuclease Cas9 [Sphingomonas sp.]|nr:type II CRISPR RNA-guided endonuclease Cas9 [Sphingomonas sp.]